MLNPTPGFACADDGHTASVHASDLATLPVRLGAAVRNRRLFHPVGVLAEGTLERVAPPGEGLPMESSSVVARVSKGLGTPGSLPDVAGVAWKMPPQLRSGTPWDVLLASTLRGRFERVALAPVSRWTGATFSSLMPYRFEGGVWWVRARLVSEVPDGLSLDAIEHQIGSGTLQFDIDQAAGTGEFRPLARLTLRNVDPSGADVAFDPILHSDPQAWLIPEWLGDVRRAAYRRSREGRAEQ